MVKSVLEGFYEEGYHYYFEITGNHLLVRDYARRPQLETTFTYDRKALAKGERTVLKLKDPVLSRDGYGKPFTWIKELAFEDGKLEMDYFYTIMGDTHYTLRKVDHGPFSYIRIRDGEFLPKLKGEWVDGINPDSVLTIAGNKLTLSYKGSPFLTRKIHVISYVSDPNEVWIVEASLTASDLGGITNISVKPDMLTFWEIVFDASTPIRAFVRKADLGKIELPPRVHDPIVNTMCVSVDEPPLTKKAEEWPPLKADAEIKEQ